MNPPTDAIDSKSNDELNELFAVEIAGWIDRRRDPEEWWEHPERGPVVGVDSFCTDANAVLPWLEKCGSIAIGRRTWLNPVDWYATIKEVEDGYVRTTQAFAPTFARCCVIALIRAKRQPEDERPDEPPKSGDVLISTPLGVAHTLSGDERSDNPTTVRVQ